MILLWQAYRGGGMGPGPLPDRGGLAEQAALMVEAFAIMSQAEADYRKEHG